MSNTTKNTSVPPAQPAPQRRPNEQGTVSVQGYFRISDPATQRTIVEGRG